MNVRPEIKERIIAAANALAAEGIEHPTNDQVRERMGKGSLSHISPIMREWREARKAEAVATLEMPADLKRVIENSVALVWTTASKLASAATEAARQEAAAAIDSAEAERDEALEEVSRLEEKLSAKEKEFAQARTLLEQERDSNKMLSTENAGLAVRLEDRDRQIKELKTELKRLNEAKESLQRDLIDIARNNKNRDAPS